MRLQSDADTTTKTEKELQQKIKEIKKLKKQVADLETNQQSKSEQSAQRTSELENMSKIQQQQIDNLRKELAAALKDADGLRQSYTDLSRRLAESQSRTKQLEQDNAVLKAQLDSMDQQGNNHEQQVQDLFQQNTQFRKQYEEL